MKNDELLDLISELKVDDAFVDEALGEQDGAPVRVYAGSSKTPMRIAAPIAASLAVVAAAGFLVVNVSRGKLAAGPAASIEESSEVGETSDTDITANTIGLFDEAFLTNCKNTVREKFNIPAQSNVTWHMNIMDIDFDSDDQYELCLYPQINGETVKDAGVCIFKQNQDGSAGYIGSFGNELRTIPLEELCRIHNIPTQSVYYYHNSEEYEKCTESVYVLHLNKDTKELQEEAYLQLVTTYPDSASSDTPYTETAYRGGIEISTEELLEEWNNIPRLPKPGILSVHGEAAEQVKLLLDECNVSVNVNQLHRTIDYMDINNDGADETLIEFRNFDALRGIYVFSSDGKFIGELDHNGDRGWNIGIGGTSLRALTDIRKFESDDESYYYYHSQRFEEPFTDTDRHSYWETAINKIVVNEDGTLSTEKYLSGIRHTVFSDQPEPDQYEFYDYEMINGNEVSSDEFQEKWRQFDFTEHDSLWF